MVEEEVDEIKQFTEKKAYAITFALLLVGILAATIQILEKFRVKELELEVKGNL